MDRRFYFIGPRPQFGSRPFDELIKVRSAVLILTQAHRRRPTFPKGQYSFKWPQIVNLKEWRFQTIERTTHIDIVIAPFDDPIALTPKGIDHGPDFGHPRLFDRPVETKMGIGPCEEKPTWTQDAADFIPIPIKIEPMERCRDCDSINRSISEAGRLSRCNAVLNIFPF